MTGGDLLLVCHVLVKILLLSKGGGLESTFIGVKLHFVLILVLKCFCSFIKKNNN